MAEIRDRFTFNNHLIAAQLFYTEKFLLYKNAFSEILLDCVRRNYPTINTSKLKSELEVIYSREEFYESAGALAILQLFMNMNLLETFSESVKLLKILCTLPMTIVESERCFSTLKRVKTFMRNTMGQSWLSSLAMLSIEKSFIKNSQHFNELVIDYFANQKDRRIDLKYKQM
ncbi:hypothetical protein ILUMI_05652 [Ignelater luminosus]|uniref:HAT C-terminal dimerisation domain-containing protein n=1 Tax=Ignelater luminosus TaxID=2038154 RepID=A0A8K0D7B2_IGNLU|nr:hypothetical protein ILUMI_05652 [Ignelater luminosus]